MMETFLIYAPLAAVIIAAIAVGTVLWRLADKLNDAKTRADNAAVAVAALRVEIERLSDDLVEHRVDVAKEYVSASALARVENALTAAINGLGDRLDKLFFQRQGK